MEKEQLIQRAEIIYEELKGKGSATFISFLEEMGNTIERKGYSDKEAINNFLEIVHNVSNTNMEIIGGGKSLKYNYKDFVDKFLKIKKGKNNYVMNNEYLKDLSLENLKFVLSWSRRILKAEEEKEEKNKKDKIKSKYYNENKNKKRNNYNKNNFEDSPFAKLKEFKF